jgi:hypothetical protein
MKTTEANLENLEFHNNRQMPKEESLKPVTRISAQNSHQEQSTNWIRRWQLACFLAAGYFSFTPPAPAHGNSGGHSGMGNSGNPQHNDHWSYLDPFPGPSYDYHAEIYDPAYSYTPTPEQQTKALQQVKSYLRGLNQRRHHAATHRYISVETLRPTKKQVADFARKQPSTRRLEPEKLRCLMVFDTQTREFVGSGCYIVSTAPRTGEVRQFEAVSAEFVGDGKL